MHGTLYTKLHIVQKCNGEMMDFNSIKVNITYTQLDVGPKQ